MTVREPVAGAAAGAVVVAAVSSATAIAVTPARQVGFIGSPPGIEGREAIGARRAAGSVFVPVERLSTRGIRALRFRVRTWTS
ncbi:hypothetical protein GCM10027598_81270 [Amycolatopsis oliviviridis]|uniref:Uncharacterized protein n=1 Tax=Amycolatopsis oliviviridis TaxID=1471590 RepID=A0ABQ3L6T8_9PSEU|nr:hypothetical protein GCM10017790_11160 [Amycolatopsis oliviviridis]